MIIFLQSMTFLPYSIPNDNLLSFIPPILKSILYTVAIQ